MRGPPAAVTSPSALAMPKSTSFTLPSYSTTMLPGLTSRWISSIGSPVIDLRLWAASRPAAASAITRTAASTGSGCFLRTPVVISLVSGCPARYSMAMK